MDLRLIPVAITAWTGAWWGLAPTVTAALVILPVVGVGAWLLRGRRWQVVAMVGALLLASGVSMLRQEQLAHSPIHRLAEQGAVGQLVVDITSDPRRIPRRGPIPESVLVPATTVHLDARDSRVRQRVPVVLRASGERGEALAHLAVGSRVKVDGRLRAADRADREVALVNVTAPPQQVRAPGWGARQVNRFRAGLRRAASHNPANQAALLPSLVVGDTSGLDADLVGDFKTTGLTHLTAVSGSNLSLTLVFLLASARWAGLRGWWVRGVSIGGVIAFVVICRAEPSVVRAAAMGLVALAGLGVAGGRARGLRHACVAVAVLVLLDPWLARSLGFALSTLATVGILWWAGDWTRAMGWAPRWLAESIAVPLAAQFATQPVVTAISGQLSVVGLAANALAAPMVGPATVLGLVAALLGLVHPWPAAAVGFIGGWCVQPVIWIAQVGAALPAAAWRWPTSPVALILLTVICLLVQAWVPGLLSRRWACVGLAVALVWGCWHQPRPAGFPGPWRVAFCDVGQGDATLLRAAPGQGVLVDTGPDGDGVVRCLRALGITSVPLLVLTHFHDDHVSGLDAVLGAVHVGRLLVNPVASPGSAAGRVRASAAARGVPVDVAAIGQRWEIGQAHLEVAGVAAGQVLAGSGEGESSAENDTSIIAAAWVQGVGVVIPGDAEPTAQQAVVARGWSPGLSVLKMPHHGSSRQDERFWCASGASLAVASAGLRNDYGHPAAAALRLASRCGMAVARTDLEGTITLWRSGDRLEVRTEKAAP